MRALWQSAVLAGSYWGACAGVFAWEAWWLRVPPAQREWNAYAPAVRARILRAVVWNQLVVNTAWLAFVNAALMPWCRARHPLTAATTPLPAWAAAPLYVLGVDVCYYALHWLVHRRALYTRVHKQHHEITVAFAPAAMYCSAAEMCGLNLLSATLPLLALNLGDAALTLIVALGPVDTVLAHSRWSTRHYAHHRHPRSYVYGSTLGAVDWLLGSLMADVRRAAATRAAWFGNA